MLWFSALGWRTEAFWFGITWRPQRCPFQKMRLVRSWRFISPCFEHPAEEGYHTFLCRGDKRGAEGLWRRFALSTLQAMNGWEMQIWGRVITIKETIHNQEDVPSLTMAYLVWNCHSSRHCCTALQPLRGSRTQLCLRPSGQPATDKGPNSNSPITSGLHCGEVTDHYFKHQTSETILPKARQLIWWHFK